MNCTKTNMSALHIWGFERGDVELARARKAGWRRADVAWERLMEAANRAFVEGRRRRALRLFRLAEGLARLAFAKGDPRRATAPGARALVLARTGRNRAARRLARRALAEWQGVEAFLGEIEIRPRARSSLFHLRMEVRHRATYHDNLRSRLRAFSAETRQTLETLLTGEPDGARRAGAHRHFGRWRGERPGLYDDTRKLLAACLLMPDARA